MGWLICALGVALAIGGSVSLANGLPYLRIDWGATEVLAGTTALSGGLVVLALGAVLLSVDRLSRRAAGAGRAAVPAAGDSTPDAVLAPAPRIGSGRVGTEVPLSAPRDLDVPDPVVRSGIDAAPPPDDRVAHERVEPHGTLETEDAPTVVGRYEANGASYVLFSDGTIEVETETGTHRFASMGDLKAHIERHEPA